MNIIEVNQSYIDINSLITWLYGAPQDGAVVTFIGKVRSSENQVISLTLEHYPQMTEKVLKNIIHQARDRWSINIMDVLKNEAPFWKKEQTSNDENWVEAKQSDVNALKKWY